MKRIECPQPREQHMLMIRCRVFEEWFLAANQRLSKPIETYIVLVKHVINQRYLCDCETYSA